MVKAIYTSVNAMYNWEKALYISATDIGSQGVQGSILAGKRSKQTSEFLVMWVGLNYPKIWLIIAFSYNG